TGTAARAAARSLRGRLAATSTRRSTSPRDTAPSAAARGPAGCAPLRRPTITRAGTARARASHGASAHSSRRRHLVSRVARRVGTREGNEGNGSKDGETHEAVYDAAAFRRPETRNVAARVSLAHAPF